MEKDVKVSTSRQGNTSAESNQSEIDVSKYEIVETENLKLKKKVEDIEKQNTKYKEEIDFFEKCKAKGRKIMENHGKS